MNNTEKTIWLEGDEKEMAYHITQYEKPKEYTKYIVRIARSLGLIADAAVYVDAACGAGAVTARLASDFPAARFVGLDLNPKYLEIARRMCARNEYHLRDVEQENWNLGAIAPHVAGIFCLQTLSWMDGYERLLGSILRQQPKWALITSLFYDGEVDARITVTDFKKSVGGHAGRTSFYNIYSLPRVREFARQFNYELRLQEAFEMPIDLPRPEDRGMGTFTVRSDVGRLQFSGPLFMPWYTLVFARDVGEPT